jgi:hypothetical protein
MAPNATGRFLAKVLGIDLDYRKEHLEGSGAVSVSSIDTCKLPSLAIVNIILTCPRC